MKRKCVPKTLLSCSKNTEMKSQVVYKYHLVIRNLFLKGSLVFLKKICTRKVSRLLLANRHIKIAHWVPTYRAIRRETLYEFRSVHCDPGDIVLFLAGQPRSISERDARQIKKLTHCYTWLVDPDKFRLRWYSFSH